MRAHTLAYVLALARRHSDAIGFLPAPVLQQYWQAGRIWLAHETRDPCGFLIVGAGWPVLRIYQACIQEDAQRLGHGSALVTRLATWATRQHYEALACWCALPLPANGFWAAQGFQRAGHRDRGGRRGRLQQQWWRVLRPAAQLTLPWGAPLVGDETVEES